ncbi:hypothetical protein ACP4OV_021132 [Aristida adscensionis]
MARKTAEVGDGPSSPAGSREPHLTADTTEFPAPPVNLEWGRSACDKATVRRLMASGAFRPGELVRILAPERGDAPSPALGGGATGARLVVLSSSHIASGLRLDASDFLLCALAHYGVEWHHLTPDSMTVLSIFAHLCEAYLGVHPTVEVFTQFYRLVLRSTSQENSTTLGGAYIGLRHRPGMKNQFPPYLLRCTHLYWNAAWFCAELAPSCRLTSRAFPLKQRSSWDSALPLSDQQFEQVRQIVELSCQGLTGADIVRDYVKHWISPLQLSVEDIDSAVSQLLNLVRMKENAPPDRSSVPTSLVGLSPRDRAERSLGLAWCSLAFWS